MNRPGTNIVFEFNRSVVNATASNPHCLVHIDVQTLHLLFYSFFSAARSVSLHCTEQMGLEPSFLIKSAPPPPPSLKMASWRQRKRRTEAKFRSSVLFYVILDLCGFANGRYWCIASFCAKGNSPRRSPRSGRIKRATFARGHHRAPSVDLSIRSQNQYGPFSSWSHWSYLEWPCNGLEFISPRVLKRQGFARVSELKGPTHVSRI